MNNPTVSVIISTRNRCKMLGNAIKSVLNQTFSDFELIIVDGASTDDTEKVIRSFNDSRIIYIKQKENISATDSLNRGLQIAKGEYIALQDDDDEWFPEKLEKQLQVFASGPSDLGVVYCWEEIFDYKNQKIIERTKQNLRGNIFLDLLSYPGYGGGSLLVFKTKVVHHIPFVQETQIPSDYYWCLKVAKYYKFDYVPEVLSRTNVNHLYGRLTDLACNDLNYQDAIQLSETILTTFAEDFSHYPQKKKYHYRSIINNAIKAKDFSKFFYYYPKAFSLMKWDYRYYGYLWRFIFNYLGIIKLN